MTPFAYYNEIDENAIAWLNELIQQRVIMDGVVDTRSILDVHPEDLKGFTQHHFFAGIGGWAYALRLAGWPDERCVWTGSCPCQPFSAAGKRGGVADERHLWPYWFHHIVQRRPHTVFGEQVASPDGLGWLDLIQADLEAAAYSVAAVDLCAAGVGAPHIRQRLWFVADTHDERSQGRRCGELQERAGECVARTSGASGELADHTSNRRGEERADRGRLAEGDRAEGFTAGSEPSGEPVNGVWADAEWIYCRDDKFRPVEPGTFPLAHGIPGRVGRLRGYGNAINPWVAKEIIEAYLATGR